MRRVAFSERALAGIWFDAAGRAVREDGDARRARGEEREGERRVHLQGGRCESLVLLQGKMANPL